MTLPHVPTHALRRRLDDLDDREDRTIGIDHVVDLYDELVLLAAIHHHAGGTMSAVSFREDLPPLSQAGLDVGVLAGVRPKPYGTITIGVEEFPRWLLRRLEDAGLAAVEREAGYLPGVYVTAAGIELLRP